MASGDLLLVFTAPHNDPPTSAQATFDLRNGHPVLDFDDTTLENAIFAGVLPRNYAGGGLTVTIIWLAPSAVAGTVRWPGEWERHQDDVDDLDADSFAAAQGVSAVTASLAGETSYDVILFTAGAQMDSLAVGESFRFRVARTPAHADDNLVGDAELLRVEVRET